MEDGIQLRLLAQVGIGGVVAGLVVLAAGYADAQAIDPGTGRRRGTHAADRAGGLAADMEAVPVGALWLQPGDLDVDAVAQLRPGQCLAGLHDAAELRVIGHLPAHRHAEHRHAGMFGQWLRRQPGPEYEAIRPRVAGGHPEGERVAGEARIGQQPARGAEAGEDRHGTGAEQQLAAVEGRQGHEGLQWQPVPGVCGRHTPGAGGGDQKRARRPSEARRPLVM